MPAPSARSSGEITIDQHTNKHTVRQPMGSATRKNKAKESNWVNRVVGEGLSEKMTFKQETE